MAPRYERGRYFAGDWHGPHGRVERDGHWDRKNWNHEEKRERKDRKHEEKHESKNCKHDHDR